MSKDDDPTRVGEVELTFHTDVVYLAIDGRHAGVTQMTPDEADELADQLKAKAAAARELKSGD